MHRRTLLAGLTGLTGTTVLGTPPHRASAAGDPVGALESALLDPPLATGRTSPSRAGSSPNSTSWPAS